MTPAASLTFRSAPLGEVITTFPGDACCILLLLARHACPRTGRVWVTPLRLAEDLRLPVTIVEMHLSTLVSSGHLSLWTRGVGALRCYVLGAVFVLSSDAPENLPVAPVP